MEIYASNIIERTSELDNCLSGLRLAMRFVEELSVQRSPSPEIYRYHYENFVLRVIGCADRAHRLIGSALQIDKDRLESTSGNSIVLRYVKTNHTAIHVALKNILQIVESYRGPRNELIHNSAYSDRELMVFQNIPLLRIDTGPIDVDCLVKAHFSTEGKKIAQTIEHLFYALTKLMNVLAPLFLTMPSYPIQVAPRKAASTNSRALQRER